MVSDTVNWLFSYKSHCPVVMFASILPNAFRSQKSDSSPLTNYRLMLMCVERVAGIEPASSAWEAEALPLDDTRTYR
jgi:hypothetical protein